MGLIIGVVGHVYFADDGIVSPSLANTLVTACETKVKSVSTITSVQPMLGQLNLLQEENTKLKLVLKNYNNQLPEQKKSDQDSTNASYNFIRNKVLKEVKSIQSAADFAKYVAASNSDYRLDIDNKFKEEAADLSWSGKHEEKIINFFNDTHALHDFVPELVECKSTKCKIRINVPNIEDSNRLTELFSKALIENDLDGSGTSVISTPDLSKGFVNLYVGKNEDTPLF